MMKAAALLALPEGMEIDQIHITETGLVVEVASITPSSCCPLCLEPSSHIHSYYHRTLKDAPCVGRQLQPRLSVRKFLCRNPDCSRKVFTERIPDLAEPWARMTTRLREQITSIGLATCGKGGVRLGERLGIETSRNTTLRRIMDLPDDSRASVVYLGIDDFGATRNYRCSCKDSRKEALTWGSAPSAEPSLNQVRLGQRSRTRKGDLEAVRGRDDC